MKKKENERKEGKERQAGRKMGLWMWMYVVWCGC